MQPVTINDVSQIVAKGIPMAIAMKAFMDLHTTGFVESDFKDAPVDLDIEQDRVFLAGAAEYLSHYSGFAAPEWTDSPEFFANKPIVFGGKKSEVALMMETPSCFRRRLLFCGRVLIYDRVSAHT